MQLTFLEEEATHAAPGMPKAAAKKPEQLISKTHEPAPMEKSEGAFKTISEAASLLDVPQHVLRFWESKFPQIKPTKLRGGRRYYRPEDMNVLSKIHHLLYKQGYTIKGALKAFSKEPEHPLQKPTLSQKISALPRVPSKTKAQLSDKQLGQIAAIQHELMGLRDVLKAYI